MKMQATIYMITYCSIYLINSSYSFKFFYMICFVRCSNIREDIRLNKYVQACRDRKLDVFAITWDRLKVGRYEEFEIPFKMYAPYGRRWKNLFNKILWQFFICYHLFWRRKRYNVIHACDFDTMLPALLVKILFKKKVVYDIYDAISIKDPKTPLERVIRFFDILFIRYCDKLILADQGRTLQIGLERCFFEKLFVVENVPICTNDIINQVNGHQPDMVYLSYVGVLDRFRGLEDLLEVVSTRENLLLYIAGVGTLQPLVEKYSSQCDRIVYYGILPYQDGLKVMAKSDIIIGMYYKNIENHRYAAPNKFYESLFEAKPLLTTEGTLVGYKVQDNDCGYVLREGKEYLRDFFSKVSWQKDSSFYRSYIQKCDNAKMLWVSKYSSYYNIHLKGDYVDMLLEIARS